MSIESAPQSEPAPRWTNWIVPAILLGFAYGLLALTAEARSSSREEATHAPVPDVAEHPQSEGNKANAPDLWRRFDMFSIGSNTIGVRCLPALAQAPGTHL